MADTDTKEKEQNQTEAENRSTEGLERGTYEIIKGRLSNAGKDLRSRLNNLNEARKEVFNFRKFTCKHVGGMWTF